MKALKKKLKDPEDVVRKAAEETLKFIKLGQASKRLARRLVSRRSRQIDNSPEAEWRRIRHNLVNQVLEISVSDLKKWQDVMKLTNFHYENDPQTSSAPTLTFTEWYRSWSSEFT